MKNYKNSSYAANKYSKDIVYNSEVSGSTAITLENFLRSDPTLTEADFEFWKKWSDQNYLEESRVNNKQSWKAVSLSNLDYILDSTQLSLEEMVEDKTMEGLVLQTLNQTVSVLLSDSVLTETMKVRFEMFYIQGMKVVEIAEAQGVGEKAVRKSLKLIKEKLINVFYELWDKNNS
jgi:hypothetical protein